MTYQKLIQNLEQLKKAPRREEVLLRVLRGQTDAEIAKEMGNIHLGTVRKQVSNIYEVLEIKSEFSSERASKRHLLVELFVKYKSQLQNDSRFTDIACAIPGETDTPPGKITPLTGVVSLESPLYVERGVDEVLRQTFSAHADESSLFIRIKGAQGTGKSSLLVRLGQFLEDEQRQTVGLVRLENTVGSEVPTDLEKLLYHFTHIVAQAFKDALSTDPPDLRDYWRHDLVPGLNCTDYLHDHIFAQLDRPKTLLIDGIDTILGQPTQTPFLELIRSWNEEKMKRVSREPIVWPHIVIAYSTEPYASLELPGGSPLQNVGMPVELPEFTEAQVLHQAQKYGLNWDIIKVKQLMALIGGHPELVNRALYQIGQNKMELDELLSQADRLNGPFRDYLLKNIKLLKDRPELSQCFVKILNKEESHDEFAKFQLEKAGLIRIEGSQASARFELYQRYFQKHL